MFRRLQWLCDLHTLVDRLTNEQLDQISSHCKKNNSHVFFLVTFSLLNRVFGSRLNRSLQSEIDTNSSVQKLTELSLREIYLSTFGIKRKSWEIMLRNHKTQYYTSGFLVLLKSIFARGVRPKTWRFFAFPDSVFFLNYVFSRIVWLAGKIKGKL